MPGNARFLGFFYYLFTLIYANLRYYGYTMVTLFYGILLSAVRKRSISADT